MSEGRSMRFTCGSGLSYSCGGNAVLFSSALCGHLLRGPVSTEQGFSMCDRWLLISSETSSPQECSSFFTRSTWRTRTITCSLQRTAASPILWPGSPAPSCRPPSKRASLAISVPSSDSSLTSPCPTRASTSPSQVGLWFVTV